MSQAYLRAVLKEAKASGIIRDFALRPDGRATVYPPEPGKYYTTGTLETLALLKRLGFDPTSDRHRATRPVSHPDEVICIYCGRRGLRAFRQVSGDGYSDPGRDQYCCVNKAACERRQAAATPKRQRTRLAKSELWIFLAMKAQEWANDVAGRSKGVRPFAEWGDDDVLVDLAKRYSLSGADLTRLLTACADELENRAERTGYSEAWH